MYSILCSPSPSGSYTIVKPSSFTERPMAKEHTKYETKKRRTECNIFHLREYALKWVRKSSQHKFAIPTKARSTYQQILQGRRGKKSPRGRSRLIALSSSLRASNPALMRLQVVHKRYFSVPHGTNHNDSTRQNFSPSASLGGRCTQSL